LHGKAYFLDDIVIHLLQLASVIGNSMCRVRNPPQDKWRT